MCETYMFVLLKTCIKSLQEGDTGELYAIPYDEPSGWVQFSNLFGLQFTDKFNPTRIALYHIAQAIPDW